MKRRTLLQLLSAFFALQPFARLRLLASPQAAEFAFTSDQQKTLQAIAEVVMPESIGSDGRVVPVARFMAWHTNYKAGADMGHGYGNSQVRAVSPAPVLPRYTAQFAALDQAAQTKGAARFADLPMAARRAIVEAQLNGPPAITRFPSRPTGANLIADFMGFYYTSAAAHDLAYKAAIGREDCRSLVDSDQPPAPLQGVR
jgi:hypothetical protein